MKRIVLILVIPLRAIDSLGFYSWCRCRPFFAIRQFVEFWNMEQNGEWNNVAQLNFSGNIIQTHPHRIAENFKLRSNLYTTLTTQDISNIILIIYDCIYNFSTHPSVTIELIVSPGLLYCISHTSISLHYTIDIIFILVHYNSIFI